MFDYERLSGTNWVCVIDNIYPVLKKEIQGTDGFLRQTKRSNEDHRKSEISSKIAEFRQTNDLSTLDFKINQLANQFMDINNKYSSILYYDHINILQTACFTKSKPILDSISRFLSATSNTVASDRLKALVSRVVNESLSQANKSNAGEAGENLTRAILTAAELVKDTHYREQYKSKEGSDTDFAFPFVENGEDYKVELFLAVQLSSNDRARLTSSELKVGAKPFVFTGNGLDASKKRMKDIGAQIIEDLKSNRVNLVCYGPELQAEKARLNNAILKAKSKTEKQKEARQILVDRLEYFERYTMSISEFAQHLKKRFA